VTELVAVVEAETVMGLQQINRINQTIKRNVSKIKTEKITRRLKENWKKQD
jgi:hypothetical protein